MMVGIEMPGPGFLHSRIHGPTTVSRKISILTVALTKSLEIVLSKDKDPDEMLEEVIGDRP